MNITATYLIDLVKYGVQTKSRKTFRHESSQTWDFSKSLLAKGHSSVLERCDCGQFLPFLKV